MLEIVVDSRESRSRIYRDLHANPLVNCTVRELPCGDFVPHPTFGVERKDAQDFVNSIMDRRLFAQVARMKDEYTRAAVLIEGDPYKTRSAISADAITGALSWLAIEGITLIPVSSDALSAAMIVTMARQLQEGLGYEIALRAGKPKDYSDLAQYLVEGSPGIGPSTAKVLLKHFGSAIAVFTATVPQLCEVPGVGKKTAERIHEALYHQVPKA